MLLIPKVIERRLITKLQHVFRSVAYNIYILQTESVRQAVYMGMKASFRTNLAVTDRSIHRMAIIKSDTTNAASIIGIMPVVMNGRGACVARSSSRP